MNKGIKRGVSGLGIGSGKQGATRKKQTDARGWGNSGLMRAILRFQGMLIGGYDGFWMVKMKVLSQRKG